MIEDISIKDFALIDNVSLEFNKGFTVFSGETGAGKSILIGALSFLLGGKASLDQIRTGTHEARVSGTLVVPQNLKDARNWLSEHAIDLENDRVLLRRIVRDTGKTAAWIGDVPVTRNELADFTQYFVDIHGQHEHQSLMKVSEHRRFLDSFALLDAEVEQYGKLYSQLQEKKKQLNNIYDAEKNRSQKIELLSFAVDEIRNARLKPNEDIELENEENRLTQYEKLYEVVEGLSNSLSGSENGNIITQLKKIRSDGERAAGFDTSLEKVSERIEALFYEALDIDSEISNYLQSLVFNPERLEEVQERSHLIYKLKQKYVKPQSSIEELLQYCDDAEKQLDLLESSEKNKEALEKEISELENIVITSAKKISQIRHETGIKLSSSVETILRELGMKGTKFSVNIQNRDGEKTIDRCNQYGLDSIEFLISANDGSPLKPLAKIASGGELSRVMLALKTVLASSDNVETLIFDEIDTGIGGEVSVAVGKHMKNLASTKQILCITHLASIAVYADNQLKIQKFSANGKTETHVDYVTGEQRVCEIARMLSGDTNSALSLDHARSMLKTYGGI